MYKRKPETQKEKQPARAPAKRRKFVQTNEDLEDSAMDEPDTVKLAKEKEKVTSPTEDIDDICKSISEARSVRHPKIRKWLKWDTVEQNKIEDALIAKMYKHYYVPLHFTTRDVPQELLDKISSRFTFALHEEKRIRERVLFSLMPPKSMREEINEIMEKYAKNFSPKMRAYKFLEENLIELEQETHDTWSKILNPTEESSYEKETVTQKNNSTTELDSEEVQITG